MRSLNGMILTASGIRSERSSRSQARTETPRSSPIKASAGAADGPVTWLPPARTGIRRPRTVAPSAFASAPPNPLRPARTDTSVPKISESATLARAPVSGPAVSSRSRYDFAARTTSEDRSLNGSASRSAMASAIKLVGTTFRNVKSATWLRAPAIDSPTLSKLTSTPGVPLSSPFATAYALTFSPVGPTPLVR